jgi:hypothetical protein
MRHLIIMTIFCAILPFTISAGEKKENPQEYAEFSRLIHSAVVKQLPKEFEDSSGWNQFIDLEPNLRLPKLRKVVKVGDKLMFPHGTWRRFKGKVEDPEKNLKIVVKEFRALDNKTYRVVADVDATILCWGEVLQWQKGLMLVGGEATADANLTAAIVCDVGVSLNFKKFPPELNIEPKVSDLKLNLVDITVRGGPALDGDGLAKDIKDLLRGLVKASEPLVKDHANRAIAQSIKEGKGTISVDAIMKALPKSAKEVKQPEPM